MKKTAEEIFNEHSFKALGAISPSKYFVLPAMEEYLQQGLVEFKVEPGLSLQQCKDEVARQYQYEDWKSSRWEGSSTLEEAAELYLQSNTASLTSEIKGLREKVQALEKDIDLAYKSGYHEGKEDARDIDYPVIQS